MKIITQFVQTENNDHAEKMVEEKMNKLAEKYDWLIRADVFFKEGPETKTPNDKVCEIRLSCPGPRIFASSEEETFEAAIAETTRDLKKQLEKRKSDMRPHT